MDLAQRKLNKSEWESIEIPVSQEEKEVLQLIMDGYSNVNIKYNKFNSLFTYLKIEYSEAMEDHLYNKYFSEKIKKLKKEHPLELLDVDVNSKPTIKKADIIRIDQNDISKLNSSIIFEFMMIEMIENILNFKNNDKKTNKNKNKPNKNDNNNSNNNNNNNNNNTSNDKWLLQYYTLSKLNKNNILLVNRHIKSIVNKLIQLFEDDIDMSIIINKSVELIEKNVSILKYSDMLLYEHQKQIFTVMRQPNPKLALYIAPTGTGKTLTPIGLSEQYRIIFVCAARHVGLALAKSAISVNKKVAFAFGCASADDIRLHYFAAKEYQVNKRSGKIAKVDNSVGDKVEIMICDLKSYLPAMYYMLSFNPKENIIVCWDEPTITMDYETHDLHETIQKNWCDNLIPNMVLMSATLPKLHELTETITDFKEKFSGADIHNIVSHDCKKSIPIVDKNGYIVLPHYLSDDYSEILKMTTHCNNNLTLLRYFDLKEIVDFIMFVDNQGYAPESFKIKRYFASLDDINMQNIKLYYLKLLVKFNTETWTIISAALKILRKKCILPNNTIDSAGNAIRKVSSIGPGISSSISSTNAGNPLQRMQSEQILPTTSLATATATATTTATATAVQTTNTGDCAVYVSTKDAYTLTDGPTIFIANDVEKIAKFCIQQSNIPAKVMDDIMEKIDFNNKINEKISILEKELEDLEAKNSMKNNESENTKHGGKDYSTKQSSNSSSAGKDVNEKNIHVIKITTQLDSLRKMIKSAELNETFIPNKQLHLRKWITNMDMITGMGMGTNILKSFTSDIDEQTIISIMMLKDVDDSWKILLLMGIGVFTNHKSIDYTEIMKKLADQQKLYMIIASSDYIYGTNYQFCHGYLSKDLQLTQDKIIQAFGRIGRNNIQQTYSIRLRDDAFIQKLFYEELDKPEVKNMNLLFKSL